MTARFVAGDARDVLPALRTGSADLVLTSPPFLKLRDYLPPDDPAKRLEIGAEATPADYLDSLLAVVGECGRVLARHGSLAVELGDTYASKGGTTDRRTATGVARDLAARGRRGWGPGWPPDKSLVGVPAAFSLSLAWGRNVLRRPPTGREVLDAVDRMRAQGASAADALAAVRGWVDDADPSPAAEFEPWRVRNVVVWCKPNPAPGAVGDRFRHATSYLVVASRSGSRWFDAEAVRVRPDDPAGDEGSAEDDGGWAEGAAPLDWWVIPTGSYSGAHDATFPEELCTVPIRSMCPEAVCTVCGSPRERTVESTRLLDGERYDPPGFSMRATDKTGRSRDGVGHARFQTVRRTVGWTDCGCPGGDGRWRRGLVLDPFCGSGTTLAVAVGNGRDAVGIDLDRRNEKLVADRLGLFLAVG